MAQDKPGNNPRQEDRRHLQTDLADRGAEGCGEGVGRGHAGDAQHDAGQESNGVVFESLVLEVFVWTIGPGHARGVASIDRLCHVASFPREFISPNHPYTFSPSLRPPQPETGVYRYSSSSASEKTTVCRSTCAPVVVGAIRAML